MSTLAEAALAAVDAGYSVIPLRPREKVPAGKWERYQTIRRTRDEVARIWQARPTLNVGLVCGRVSGVSVVDLDPRNDPTGETTRWLTETMPPPTVISPHGWHWYIAETWPTLGNARPGLDLKGEGGYVLAPPSIHPSGKPYELRGGVVSLPDSVRDVLQAELARRAAKRREQQAKTTPDDGDRLSMQEVLRLLGKTRPTSSGWLARCPAHDDGNPSLTVGYGRDGRVLLHCWAKCAFEDVVRALRERESAQMAVDVRSIRLEA
jgi:Bifunctional DNA primase/polymerase, N-terminal